MKNTQTPPPMPQTKTTSIKTTLGDAVVVGMGFTFGVTLAVCIMAISLIASIATVVMAAIVAFG